MGAYLSSRKEQRIAEAESLVEQHPVLPFDKAAAARASQIRSELRSKGAEIEIRDLFNGAICTTRRMSILTSNKAHYERIPDLLIVSP